METADRSEFDLRLTPQAERSEQLAIDVLRVISASLDSDAPLSDFQDALAARVADLVGAERATFMDLEAGRKLPQGPNLMSAPWRAGEERLGAVVAYDSRLPDGFTDEDAWVLQITGMAAGLVWQLKRTEARLNETIERLQKVDLARQILLRNLASAVDRASKHFAANLHDDALQKLTAAEIRLASVTTLGSADDQTRTGIEEAGALLAQVEEALRKLLQNVRPPALETPGGLEKTIRERLAALHGQSGVDVDYDIELSEEPPYEIKSILYRQISEALTNIEKHAGATRIRIAVKPEDGGLYGAITDNGKGFIVAERERLPGHLGLLALVERPLLAGGWGKISSEPGAGTIIEFWVPIPK